MVEVAIAIALRLRGGVLGDILPVALEIALATAATGLLLVAFQLGGGTCSAGLRDAALFGDGVTSLALAIPVRGVAGGMSFEEVTEQSVHIRRDETI